MIEFWIVILSIEFPFPSQLREKVSSTPQVTDMWSNIMFEPFANETESSRVPAYPL